MPYGHWAIAILLLLAAACVDTRHLTRNEGRESVVLGGVPFYSADEHECGAAAVAEVMTYWGVPTATEEIAKETVLPTLNGSLPIDLARAVRRRGLVARMEYGDLESLKAWVRSGRPAILQLNYGTSFFRIGHFLLVYGFDDRRGVVLAHSSREEATAIPYASLDRDWAGTGHWALLIVPPEPSGRAGEAEAPGAATSRAP